MKQRVRPAKRVGKVFDGDRPKLEASRRTASDRRCIGIDDGIRQSADARYDGDCAISQGAKLRQPARLEPRRHHDRIRAGLDQMRQIFIIADQYADPTRIGYCRCPVTVLQVGISTSEHDHLHAVTSERRQALQQQI